MAEEELNLIQLAASFPTEPCATCDGAFSIRPWAAEMRIDSIGHGGISRLRPGRLPEMSFVCVIPSRSLAGWATTAGSFPSSALVPLHAWISCLEIILCFARNTSRWHYATVEL